MSVKKKSRTVVDIAKGDANFSMLTRALEAADLIDTLTGNGPFTVFAPTDAAFEKLSKRQRDDLFKPEQKNRLKKILQRHVVQGRQMSQDLTSRSSLTPLAGDALRVQGKGKTVRFGPATITKADLEAENGVVHVIDQILMS